MIFDRDAHNRRRARQANLLRVEILRGLAVARVSLRRLVLRAVLKDHHIPIACRLLAGQHLRRLWGLSSLTRHTRRCRISGRPRQVLRRFGLARMHLRQQFHERLLPGVAQKRW